MREYVGKLSGLWQLELIGSLKEIVKTRGLKESQDKTTKT